MAFDFPASPAIGTVYPATGTPLYQWDGSVWNSVTPSFVLKSGDTMTGPLTLPSDPASTLQAATKQYVDTRVRFDAAQGLTAAQQLQARQNIYAAPFDALAYNGMQINGSMDVSQQNGTTAVTTSGSYIVDGWLLNASGTMAISVAQVADAPPGYTNSIKASVTTAEASLGASDFVGLIQVIEGFRSSRLAFGAASAQPISIGFWTKNHRTGAYSGSIRNSATARSYPFSFTQNVADTWEYKTVTIPGDVTGTWVGNTNGIGLGICFTMACGTTFQAPANAWAAGNFIAATGTTNGVAANTDYMQITGVVILPGIELPSASRAPFIMRSYDQELPLCERYFEKWDVTGVGGYSVLAVGTWANTTQLNAVCYFRRQKRIVPGFAISALTDFVSLYNGGGTPVALSSLGALYPNTNNMMLQATSSATTSTPGQVGLITQNNSAAAKAFFDARL
jgi:hypothetical protein